VANGQTLIKLENVTKIFYTDEVETHALSGIHLDINKGEYVSIAGPSGCGKSTLLSIIGLLDSPTDGSYVLNTRAVQGLDFSDRARIRNQEIGFIFQSFNLIGDLTVYENVELPLTYRQRMPSAERKGRVMEALERDVSVLFPGAADVIRRAMIRMPKALADAGLSSRMLLQVHDELIFEASEAEADATCAVARAVMERSAEPAVSLSVPLVVDARAAANWDEAH